VRNLATNLHNKTPALILLAALLFLPVQPNASYTIDPVALSAEFDRALKLIDTTQLDDFRTDKPEPTPLTRQRVQQQIIRDQLDHKASVALMRKALNHKLESYNDPFANYITPAALQRYRERRSGSYVGVGLKFRTVANQYPWVIGALLDSPLSTADITSGDKLLRAGGTDLKGLSDRQVANTLKGSPGSRIELTIERNGSQHNISTVRRSITRHYARSHIIDNNIGYIRISRFGANTHHTVKQQIATLLKQNVRYLVLDLRDNPGGSTRAARGVASLFSDAATIYCEKLQSGKLRQLPRHGDKLTDLPLAVLINGQSMSSAEIVAGALQSWHRATLVGTPTFGKGLVQRVFDLKAPLGGAIRTTVAAFGTGPSPFNENCLKNPYNPRTLTTLLH